MTMKYRGMATVYTVVGEHDGAHYGLAATIEKNKRMIVRFSTLGIASKPPKHFNFRSQAKFQVDGEDGPRNGIYFDKLILPITETSVSIEALAKFADSVDMVEILSEWAVKQFKLEGIEVDPGLVTGVFVGVFAVPEAMEIVSAWKPPKDIWHEPKKQVIDDGNDDADFDQ